MRVGDNNGLPAPPLQRPALADWSSRDWMTVLGLTILAFALRVFHLDYRGLWTDEFITLYKVQLTTRELIGYCLSVGHTPGYFLLLKAWTMVAGTSDWALRFPSAVAGALLVPATALFARPFASRPFVVLLLVWACIGGYLVWSSQEARMYSMLVLAATISHAAYLRTLESSTLARWAAYFACVLAGTLLHPLMMLFAIGHLSFGVFQWRHHPSHARVALGVGGLVFLGALIAVAGTDMLGRRMHAGGFKVTRFMIVWQRLGYVAFGDISVLPAYRYIVAGLLAIAALGAWSGWRNPKANAGSTNRAAIDPLLVQFCLFAVLVPTLLIWIVSFFLEQIIGVTRYLIPAAIPLCVLIVWGIARLPLAARRLAAGASGAVLLVSLASQLMDPGTGGREMIRHLHSIAAVGDIVVSQRPLSDPVAFDHYGDPSKKLRMIFVPPGVDAAEEVEALREVFRDHAEAWIYIYRSNKNNLETFITTASGELEIQRTESQGRAKLFKVRILKDLTTEETEAGDTSKQRQGEDSPRIGAD